MSFLWNILLSYFAENETEPFDDLEDPSLWYLNYTGLVSFSSLYSHILENKTPTVNEMKW